MPWFSLNRVLITELFFPFTLTSWWSFQFYFSVFVSFTNENSVLEPSISVIIKFSGRPFICFFFCFRKNKSQQNLPQTRAKSELCLPLVVNSVLLGQSFRTQSSYFKVGATSCLVVWAINSLFPSDAIYITANTVTCWVYDVICLQLHSNRELTNSEVRNKYCGIGHFQRKIGKFTDVPNIWKCALCEKSEATRRISTTPSRNIYFSFSRRVEIPSV